VPNELRDNAVRLALDVLEPIRERWGGPLVVVSWYRTPWHNKAIGGAEKSQHMLALAADIAPVVRTKVPELRGLVEQMLSVGELPALGGLGVYPAWIHVDARPRPDGHIARWWGRGIGSEP
jgi:uncharacterized protein YcbK (DUF882 family)